MGDRFNIPPHFRVEMGGLRLVLREDGMATWSGAPVYDDESRVLGAIDALLFKMEKRAALLRRWQEMYLAQKARRGLANG